MSKIFDSISVSTEVKEEIDRYFDDLSEEDNFQPCIQCDGHPACEDFGCAFEHGCGHLVKPDFL